MSNADSDDSDLGDSEDVSDVDSEVEDKLCAPRKTLFVRLLFYPAGYPVSLAHRGWVQVQYGGLQHFGLTSVFRLGEAPLDTFRYPRTPQAHTAIKHVLLLPVQAGEDAAVPQCECWETCWARHLPSFDEVPLTREEHDKCAAHYFSDDDRLRHDVS